jgi:hypothetical protein
LVIEHPDGWRSYYLHLDNDTPGTDDGLAGAPAPGIAVGVRVEAGDVLDYVGDSGNAEETPSHLHFELHRPDGVAINPTSHLRAAQSSTTDGPQTAGTEWSTPVRPPIYDASGTEFVGHLDPGGGFAAGVTVSGDVAYMGTWGRPTACPGWGVRLIDVADPRQPSLLGSIATAADFPGTSTDSVWVGSVANDSFVGEMAVVAVRLCDTSERHRHSEVFRGIALYDVTDPVEPRLLSNFHTGDRTQGANEVTVATRADGTLLIAASVMQSALHTEGALGDFRLIDATDPSHPVSLADWDPRRDLLQGDDRYSETAPVDLHVHSAWLAPDGMSAWLAVWDGGVVSLDLTDPASLEVVMHVPVAAGTAGNAHTVVFDQGSGLLIRSDENLDPKPGDESSATWGGQTIYDASLPDAPQLLSRYESPGAGLTDGEPDYSGYFSAHEVVILGDLEYVSWYSDGLRIVDLSDPANPTEVASFVPSVATDPQQHWITRTGNRSFPMTWGVTVFNGLIYLSDMNTGLWIVRYVPPPLEPRLETGEVL